MTVSKFRIFGVNRSQDGNVADADNQNNEVIEKSAEQDKTHLSQQPSSRFGSICWLNMIPTNSANGSSTTGGPHLQQDNASVPGLAKSTESGLTLANSFVQPSSASPDPGSNSCCSRMLHKISTVVRWVFHDFQLKHLVWIKLIFFFQSASMTVLYPYLNLHMKSLGLSIQEVAVINAVIPVLFIFTPPLAGFLAEKVGNFRILLSILTALGGFFALLLLLIPPSRDVSLYPDQLRWGVSCGRPGNRARFQKLMLHGFKRDDCELRNVDVENATFTPGTCGYLCPTKSAIKVKPYFVEYKVIWPNRGGGFGISEIVDVVNLDSPEARTYHEPDVVDNNIFFPMNWTFHLSCDRIRTNDCIFNPITRAPSKNEFKIHIKRVTSPFRSSNVGPSFDIVSIVPPETGLPVITPVNCGAKEVIAQVISTVDTSSLSETHQTVDGDVRGPLVDTRFSGCGLHCLVNLPRSSLCNNTHAGVVYDPSLTFWTYLIVRTVLGVLTAASLMMFEGAVMATVQEMGGDYGIQRFVGNFGAIIFAPLGGYIIDATSSGIDDEKTVVVEQTTYAAVIYVYLGLKIVAAVMIMMIQLDFKPPGERILSNIRAILKNAEVLVFLGMMMFAGTFWGFIEAFLFWYLDDLGASHFLMGWTVAVGMVTSLPFLVFSGPITDVIGHMNVIIVGMLAYTARLLGYSFITDPAYVYPFEALEGLTMALMMTSAVTYVAKISSSNTIASVMGLMGALFFGVGKGSGSLFGGLLMSAFGAPATFRTFAVTAFVCSIGYGFFQWLYVKPRRLLASEDGNSSVNPCSSHDQESNPGKFEAEKPIGIVAFGQLKPNQVESSSTLAHDESLGKIIGGRFDDFSPSPSPSPPPPPPPPLMLDGSPIPAPRYTSGPRSITGGTRV